MEEIGPTNPKYQPLRVLWRRSCAHARKTIPLAPIIIIIATVQISKRVCGTDTYTITYSYVK